MREDGVLSDRATYINQAIKAAYDQRAGMAYIQPASAYLRSSFAATSLQSDPLVAWSNLLEEEAKRSSPFLSQTLVKQGLQDNLLVKEEFDKQFWQNINSVRVAGAGLTNYVVTKDDIGNWYVKSFSSDPTKMLQSAKNLALFSLGGAGAASPDAVSEPAAPSASSPLAGDSVPPTPTTTPTSAPTTGVERVLQKYQSAYLNTTTSDYQKVLSLDSSVSTEISSAWDSDAILDAKNNSAVPEFKKDLASAITQLQTDLSNLKGAKAADQGSSIVSALEAVRRSYLTLASKIRQRQIADSIHSDQLAIKDAARVVRNILVAFTKSRQDSVKSFETAIIFVGEAAK